MSYIPLRSCVLLSVFLLLSFGFFSCEEESFAPVGMEDDVALTQMNSFNDASPSLPETDGIPDCGCVVQVVSVSPNTTMRLAAFDGTAILEPFLATRCNTPSGVGGNLIFDRLIDGTGTFPINNYGYSHIDYNFAAKISSTDGGGVRTIMFNILCGNNATYNSFQNNTGISLGTSGTGWSGAFPSTAKTYLCSDEPVCGDVIFGSGQ